MLAARPASIGTGRRKAAQVAERCWLPLPNQHLSAPDGGKRPSLPKDAGPRRQARIYRRLVAESGPDCRKVLAPAAKPASIGGGRRKAAQVSERCWLPLPNQHLSPPNGGKRPGLPKDADAGRQTRIYRRRTAEGGPDCRKVLAPAGKPASIGGGRRKAAQFAERCWLLPPSPHLSAPDGGKRPSLPKDAGYCRQARIYRHRTAESGLGCRKVLAPAGKPASIGGGRRKVAQVSERC